MELSKNDLELTLKELKNQRVQLTTQLTIIEFGIKGIQNKLK